MLPLLQPQFFSYSKFNLLVCKIYNGERQISATPCLIFQLENWMNVREPKNEQYNQYLCVVLLLAQATYIFKICVYFTKIQNHWLTLLFHWISFHTTGWPLHFKHCLLATCGVDCTYLWNHPTASDNCHIANPTTTEGKLKKQLLCGEYDRESLPSVNTTVVKITMHIKDYDYVSIHFMKFPFYIDCAEICWRIMYGDFMDFLPLWTWIFCFNYNIDCYLWFLIMNVIWNY